MIWRMIRGILRMKKDNDMTRMIIISPEEGGRRRRFHKMRWRTMILRMIMSRGRKRMILRIIMWRRRRKIKILRRRRINYKTNINILYKII